MNDRVATWLSPLAAVGAIKVIMAGQRVRRRVRNHNGRYTTLPAADAQLAAVGDTFTYRNMFQSRSWHRSEVQRFEITPTWWSHRVNQIQMHTADGQLIGFTITTAPWRRIARIERWCTALEDWRTDTSQACPS